MIRKCLLFTLLLLAACDPDFTRSMPLGGRDVAVAIVDCIEPQRGYVVDEVEYFGWHVAENGDVTVRCGDLGRGGAGSYTLGTNIVRIDPAQAPGEAIKAATGHELTHWMLDHSPRPSLGRLHICWFARNEAPPPGCHPTIVAKNALMSPSLSGANGWNGDYETFVSGSLPEWRVTEADRELIDSSLSP